MGNIYWQKQGTAIGTGLPRLIMLIIYVCFGDKNAKRVRI